MYNSNNKQYIFKKSSNRIWNLLYDNKNGICYSNLVRRNVWTMPMSLEKQAQESFSACMDSKDVLHIIYQNSHGNIFYLQLDETSITSLPMLSSKYPSLYNKYFKIISVKNNLHSFYVLHHKNKYLLTHQIISNKEVKDPQVLGYLNKNNLPYTVCTNKSGDIYLFYQTASSGNLQQQTSAFQVGYKKYSSSNQLWEEFVSVPVINSKFDYPCVIIDNTDLIHFSYQKLVADRYELSYRQKTAEGNNWSSETTIHTSLNPFENSSIICIDDRVIIFWVRNDTIYYSYSIDKGGSWSKPAKYNFPIGRQLACVSYSTNDFYEISRISMNEIPGSLISGLKLAFYEDFFNNENINENKEGLRNIITDSLKTFNETLDGLIESNNNIKADIKRLKLFNTNILREIDKLSIKINFLENQIKQKKIDAERDKVKIIETEFVEKSLIDNDFDKTEE